MLAVVPVILLPFRNTGNKDRMCFHGRIAATPVRTILPAKESPE
jgi:hypothetical protein